MKKIFTLVVMIVLLSTIAVFAEEELPEAEVLLKENNESSVEYHYVTHVDNKTYIIYSDFNFLEEEYYHLGIIDDGEIKEIGEIDEMIGGNNEPKTYEVVGTTQADMDYFKVTGMVQMDGDIYISKKRHIYKLDGDKFKEIPLSYKGDGLDMDKFDIGKYDAVIDKFVTNGKNLYMTLKPKAVYMTADSYSIFESPLTGLVLRVTEKGLVSPTWALTPQAYFNTNANFTVNSDESFIASSLGYGVTEYDTSHCNNTGLAKRSIAKFESRFELGPLNKEEEHYANTIYYDDEIYACKTKYTYSASYVSTTPTGAYVIIKRIDKGEYVKTRYADFGAYLCTTEEMVKLPDVEYVINWSLGDNDYIYAVASGGEKTSILRFKP